MAAAPPPRRRRPPSWQWTARRRGGTAAVYGVEQRPTRIRGRRGAARAPPSADPLPPRRARAARRSGPCRTRGRARRTRGGTGSAPGARARSRPGPSPDVEPVVGDVVGAELVAALRVGRGAPARRPSTATSACPRQRMHGPESVRVEPEVEHRRARGLRDLAARPGRSRDRPRSAGRRGGTARARRRAARRRTSPGRSRKRRRSMVVTAGA